jgi:hypothetical protein
MVGAVRRLHSAETGELQVDSTLGGNFLSSPIGRLKREILSSFQKPRILRPDREFESHLLGQLVCCFCREIRPAANIAKYPKAEPSHV